MSNDAPVTSAQKRIVSVLFVAQSFFSASSIAAFTLSPIISSVLSGSDSWVGLPNTITLLGRAGFALPLGIMMDRIGRRLALSSGYSMAIIGSAVSVWAILSGSFPIFLLGALFLGMARSAGDQSRYVGAEVFTLSRRAKVIGLIVSAGTIGAIFGPLLVPASTGWVKSFGLPEETGPFIVSGILMLYATGAVLFFLRPDPRELSEAIAVQEAADNPDSLENSVGERRPLRQIFAAPMVQLAILAMVIAFFVMSFLMVITPLHMDRAALTTAAISTVIMAHTLGMYGLSWLTGGLIDRFGRIPMILAGTAILGASCILAPLSLHIPILSLALFLLGLGWNFCYVAGSSLLSDALAAHERPRAQGASEALVAVTAGLASLSVGLVFAAGGYLLVSVIALIATLLLVLSTYWLVRKERRLAAPVVGL